MYFIYGNSGIDKVKKELENPKETFVSIKEVFEKIKERHGDFLNIANLSVKYYAYDDRIEKDVYMVVTDRFGDENYIEKYKCPQFVSYLINI